MCPLLLNLYTHEMQEIETFRVKFSILKSISFATHLSFSIINLATHYNKNHQRPNVEQLKHTMEEKLQEDHL